MTLTLLASGFIGTSVTYKDSCPAINSNAIVLVEDNTPSLRVYNASTLAFMASSTLVNTSAIAVTMVNALSALVMYSSVTSLDLVEIATGYRQNYVGGATPPGSRSLGGQMIAGDPSQNIALGITSTNIQLLKFNGNTFTVGLQLWAAENDTGTCIILKGPNRWLLGTLNGLVYEIDSFLNVIDSFNLRLVTFPVGTNNPLGNQNALRVTQMAYDTNMLILETDGTAVLVVDWSTKTIIKTWTPEAAVIQPLFFSQSSSGELLMTADQNNDVMYEMDMTVSPLTVRGFFYTDSISPVATIGMNASGIGWFVDQASPVKIRSFNVTPRATTTRTITVMNTSGAGGVNQQARLTIIDDTSGTGTAFTILDTVMQSPGTYRVPTGRTLMEVVKVGSGVNATYDLSRYNT